MKKVFFSFAIATVMAGLVACNGSSNQNTDGQDSTAVEAEAETEAEAEAADPNRQELDDVSVVVPEGWKNQSISSSMFFIRQEPEPSYANKSERLFVKSKYYNSYSMEKFIEGVSRGAVVEEKGTTTIDGLEFKVLSLTSEKDTTIDIVGEKSGGLYDFGTNEKSYANPDIQKILQSIKLLK
jgi:hypothetical protein